MFRFCLILGYCGSGLYVRTGEIESLKVISIGKSRFGGWKLGINSVEKWTAGLCFRSILMVTEVGLVGGVDSGADLLSFSRHHFDVACSSAVLRIPPVPQDHYTVPMSHSFKIIP